MSLPLRLALGFTLLLALLAGAALAGLHRLTEDMREALGATVTEVSHSLIAVLNQGGHDAHSPPPLQQERVERHMRVVVNGRELSPEEIAALPAEELPKVLAGPDADAFRIEVKREGPGARAAMLVHGLGPDARAIPISESRADAAIAGFRDRLLSGFVALLLLGAVLATLLARRISAPLQALAAAAARWGRGELDARVAPGGPPELRQSIEAFNRMAADLQRLRVENEAAQADRELAELGEIGRGLAHSLRNPLHALGLSLDALAGGGDSERGAALAAAGREQLARIDQALRGFLALSASSGAHPQPVDLDEVVDDVVLEASQRAQGQVHFIRERSGLRLLAVAAELRILLHALVVNALEASPAGASVEIGLRSGAGQVLISVADRGPGVPAELRDRLFQPHVSSKPTGAGMGLYLAERLARQRYRGSLRLLDREGGGTRAELRLGERSLGP